MARDSFLLRINGLTKRFGGVAAVNQCSLSLEANRIYGLIGPNGSGKTTLFNLITGLLKSDAGEIHFKGEKTTRLPPYKICRRGIGRTFQVIRVFPEMTVLDNMIVVAPDGGVGANRPRALDLLDFVGLTYLRDEYAGNLSYGQQRLLEFVRVLMTNPELILLDEPAAGVNPTLLNNLLEYIRELRKQGKTIVVVEHNMKVVMNLCEQIFVLDHGEKIAEGPPETIQRDERVLEAYFGR
ncbi:MAG: ABC transporter ATP-binding protein [Candidatus Methylomirabilia bacterium]